MRCDSAGPGKWRGGLGTRKRYRITGPCKIYLNVDRTECLPWGVCGGLSARPGQATIYKQGKSEPMFVYKAEGVPLEAGDVVCIETGGGGGYGSPLERPRELVEQDVRRGYVSPEAAKEFYGFTIEPDKSR